MRRLKVPEDDVDFFAGLEADGLGLFLVPLLFSEFLFEIFGEGLDLDVLTTLGVAIAYLLSTKVEK